MSNKSNGNKFETTLCAVLSTYGFWAHNFTQSKQGQPSDIIACKNNDSYLIDCKECRKDEFPLSRIEENQITSMQLFEKKGNKEGLFALKLKGGEVYILSLKTLLSFEKGALNKNDIVGKGVELEKWLVNQNAYRN